MPAKEQKNLVIQAMQIGLQIGYSLSCLFDGRKRFQGLKLKNRNKFTLSCQPSTEDLTKKFHGGSEG